MTVTLKVRWDGEVPGLEAHEVSLVHFADAMKQLQSALLGTASNLLSKAEDPEKGTRGGRRQKGATQLDVRLIGIETGCAVLNIRITHPGPTTPLGFDADLPERTALDFTEGLEAESKGLQRNGHARKYLRTLPEGLDQTYTVLRGDHVVKQVQIRDPKLADAVPEMPAVQEYVGRVTGVSFEPGKPRITLLDADGTTLKFDATPAQVERALELRDSEVRLKALVARRNRVLLIRASRDRPERTREQVIDSVFADREDLLRRLAN